MHRPFPLLIIFLQLQALSFYSIFRKVLTIKRFWQNCIGWFSSIVDCMLWKPEVWHKKGYFRLFWLSLKRETFSCTILHRSSKVPPVYPWNLIYLMIDECFCYALIFPHNSWVKNVAWVYFVHGSNCILLLAKKYVWIMKLCFVCVRDCWCATCHMQLV